MTGLVLIGVGFLIAAAGALLMRYRDRLGRIVLVFGATLIMAGTVWQAVAGLL